jgi:hypothetical protein
MAKLKTLSWVLAGVLAATPLVACDSRGTDRWATTENTNVKIDWDRVNEAYKTAEGPEDFERKVNEIYEGDEVISVAVEDKDDKTQVVTGFFDKNTNGGVEEDEKVFTITRNITGEGTGNYQVAGYGPYYGYHSPMLSIASGMLLGSMLSSAFMPGYRPMYSRPYVTPASRVSSLRSTRNSYRAANPSKFTRTKASGSGRAYNRTGGSFGGRSGGTRFGIRGRVHSGKTLRLDA